MCKKNIRKVFPPDIYDAFIMHGSYVDIVETETLGRKLLYSS